MAADHAILVSRIKPHTDFHGDLESGLAKMIAELSVTGLTSNPTIFEKAIGKGAHYDAAIEALVRKGLSDEALFFE